jgi:hypothetical protein
VSTFFTFSSLRTPLNKSRRGERQKQLIWCAKGTAQCRVCRAVATTHQISDRLAQFFLRFHLAGLPPRGQERRHREPRIDSGFHRIVFASLNLIGARPVPQLTPPSGPGPPPSDLTLHFSLFTESRQKPASPSALRRPPCDSGPPSSALTRPRCQVAPCSHFGIQTQFPLCVTQFLPPDSNWVRSLNSGTSFQVAISNALVQNGVRGPCRNGPEGALHNGV